MLSLWVWWTHVSVAIYWSSKDANMDPGKIACSYRFSQRLKCLCDMSCSRLYKVGWEHKVRLLWSVTGSLWVRIVSLLWGPRGSGFWSKLWWGELFYFRDSILSYYGKKRFPDCSTGRLLQQCRSTAEIATDEMPQSPMRLQDSQMTCSSLDCCQPGGAFHSPGASAETGDSWIYFKCIWNLSVCDLY